MAQKYEKFLVEKNVVITFKDTIKSSEVGTYLKDKIEDFYEGTRFMVLCGVHHSEGLDAEGKLKISLEHSDMNFVDDYENMFEDVKKIKKSIWDKRNYCGTVEQIRSQKQRDGTYKVNRG